MLVDVEIGTMLDKYFGTKGHAAVHRQSSHQLLRMRVVQ